jgi:hypothetical protein
MRIFHASTSMIDKSHLNCLILIVFVVFTRKVMTTRHRICNQPRCLLNRRGQSTARMKDMSSDIAKRLLNVIGQQHFRFRLDVDLKSDLISDFFALISPSSLARGWGRRQRHKPSTSTNESSDIRQFHGTPTVTDPMCPLVTSKSHPCVSKMLLIAYT